MSQTEYYYYFITSNILERFLFTTSMKIIVQEFPHECPYELRPRILETVVIPVNNYAQQVIKIFCFSQFYLICFLCSKHFVRDSLRIWSHLLNKSLMENFIFCVVILCVNKFLLFTSFSLLQSFYNFL